VNRLKKTYQIPVTQLKELKGDGEWEWQTFFGSIDLQYETNSFQTQLFSSMKIVVATGFGGLWA